jgi:hypothetical protein
MRSISRMILWPDIILQQQSCGVEIMNKGVGSMVRCIRGILRWIVEDGVLKILFRIEVFVDGINLGNISHIGDCS